MDHSVYLSFVYAELEMNREAEGKSISSGRGNKNKLDSDIWSLS
jgi:hypothetical protein